MWKHSHLNLAYAVYLDPTKGKPHAVPSRVMSESIRFDKLDPPDAIFLNKTDAEQWISGKRYEKAIENIKISNNKEITKYYPLAVILTIENAWLPTWTNVETITPIDRPYPLPDFLIESIGRSIVDTIKRANNETR